MKIIFLSPFPSAPLYGGAVVRNHYLSRALAKRHQVVASFCGPSGDPQWVAEVPLSGTGLRALFDPFFLWRARKAIAKHKVEAIVASSLISGLHGLILKICCGLPFWMDEHNVEWMCTKRYRSPFWPLIYLLEGLILKAADVITCVSEEDRKCFISCFNLAKEKLRVAPNGVDLKSLAAKDLEPQRMGSGRKVLFFGVLDYPPNRQAVLRLSREIVPLAPKDIEFLIAGVGGKDLPSLCPNLNFLGFVEDIHALVKRCDGVLVPLSSGGGTRMKIIEAAACQRPVFSTVLGAEGLDLQAFGPTLTVSDSIESMLDWLKALPRQNLVKPNPSFKDLYDWEAIWERNSPW